MVYPAVNAFTASEPGRLTKPLREMNNFVSYDSDKGSPTSGLPHLEGTVNNMPLRITHVTPEIKTRSVIQSPQSSLSTQSLEISPPPTNKAGEDKTNCLGISRENPKKRAHKFLSRNEPDGLVGIHRYGAPLADTLTLRPEHYRAVSQKPRGEDHPFEKASAFQYPHVPLSFTERKRLSDALFLLSKEIPNMSREVANLLRNAREHDEWDLAVAEILTQVVVGLYCAEGDHRLDGLQQYLLRLGISC